MQTDDSITIFNLHPRRERSREHLTQAEVAKLLNASRDKTLSRHPERDYCLFLLMVRHGLRVTEACRLKLSDVHMEEKELNVKRLKNGKPATHPLFIGEVKAIKDWMAKRQEMSLDALTLGAGDSLFISERRTPLSRSMVWLLMQRYAKAAGLECLHVHPHMLRHACGFDMAHRGTDTRLIQGFLGHKNIQHTVKYTELDPERFKTIYPMDPPERRGARR
jgi:type 1 fimbriae regulatory protein FimB